ncbi:MAG: hypothetical protein ACI4AW_01680, partial [Paludibacteraceae bacterium]
RSAYFDSSKSVSEVPSDDRDLGTPEGQLEQPQALACSLALLERRIAAIRVLVCDGNAMRVR